jgi:hypothetical protein
MTQTPSDRPIQTALSLDHWEKLRRQLKSGLITFPEYAYNVTLVIISSPDEIMEEAVKLIPSDVTDQYQEYLRAHLEPVDYMPCPLPFLAGSISEEAIGQKKRQLRQKYIRLHGLVKDKLACYFRKAPEQEACD